MTKLHTTELTDSIFIILNNQGLPVKKDLSIAPPDFPEDITSVDDQALMSLARAYMENYNFLLTQVACAELALEELENKYDFETAQRVVLMADGRKETVTITKAKILISPEIQKLSTELLHSKAYHKLLKTTLDNLERYYQLTSRELTRRTSVLKARGF